MFNQSKFIIDNLTNGFANGSFSAEQVNIFAMNYKLKGLISDEQFNEIVEFVSPAEEAEAVESEVSADE